LGGAGDLFVCSLPGFGKQLGGPGEALFRGVLALVLVLGRLYLWPRWRWVVTLFAHI